MNFPPNQMDILKMIFLVLQKANWIYQYIKGIISHEKLNFFLDIKNNAIYCILEQIGKNTQLNWYRNSIWQNSILLHNKKPRKVRLEGNFYIIIKTIVKNSLLIVKTILKINNAGSLIFPDPKLHKVRIIQQCDAGLQRDNTEQVKKNTH